VFLATTSNADGYCRQNLPDWPTWRPIARGQTVIYTVTGSQVFSLPCEVTGSRKLENHIAAVALNYSVYNFIRIHRKLRTSPAMAAGVTSKLWEVSDLVALLVAAESKKAA
jgi:hypothetical protein